MCGQLSAGWHMIHAFYDGGSLRARKVSKRNRVLYRNSQSGVAGYSQTVNAPASLVKTESRHTSSCERRDEAKVQRFLNTTAQSSLIHTNKLLTCDFRHINRKGDALNLFVVESRKVIWQFAPEQRRPWQLTTSHLFKVDQADAGSGPVSRLQMMAGKQDSHGKAAHYDRCCSAEIPSSDTDRSEPTLHYGLMNKLSTNSLKETLKLQPSKRRRVAMSDPRTPYFVHRANQDGSQKSVCLRCFVTVASAFFESDLEKTEQYHLCAGTFEPKDLPGYWRAAASF
jgi:hypothetical protein